MNINFKLRLQNKTTLVALIALVLHFVYTLLGMFGVVPAVTENMANSLLISVVDILAALGVVVDPTTKGIGDSTRALYYSRPYDEEADAVLEDDEHEPDDEVVVDPEELYAEGVENER